MAIICLSDFIALPEGEQAADCPAGWLGLFALSAGFGVESAADEYFRKNDNYSPLLLTSLANALTEAFTEEIHLRVRREWWAYAKDESLSAEEILKGGYKGIRPAFGYPCCPDHEDKRIAFELLETEKRCGMKLSESAMIIPAASVCGMVFASPAAYYFGLGTIGDDQLKDWAGRKGISIEEARKMKIPSTTL